MAKDRKDVPSVSAIWRILVTLRHDSKLMHIGVGRRYKGTSIHLYVADLDVRIVGFDGELLRHLILDPKIRLR